jgi:hypothetical protein
VDAEAPDKSAVEEPTSFVQRVAKLVTRVAGQYVTNAKKELESDIVRLAVGAGFVFISAVFGVHTVIVAHVAIVVGISELGAPLWAVVIGLLLVDVMVFFFCLLMARLLLWRPLLPRTRKQVGEAWRFLVG